MLIRRRKPIPSSEITDERDYLDRRFVDQTFPVTADAEYDYRVSACRSWGSSLSSSVQTRIASSLWPSCSRSSASPRRPPTTCATSSAGSAAPCDPPAPWRPVRRPPREPGAKFLVTADTLHDTIGGGHLELRAVEIAREMLAKGAKLTVVDAGDSVVGHRVEGGMVARRGIDRDLPQGLHSHSHARSAVEMRLVGDREEIDDFGFCSRSAAAQSDAAPTRRCETGTSPSRRARRRRARSARSSPMTATAAEAPWKGGWRAWRRSGRRRSSWRRPHPLPRCCSRVTRAS